MRVLALLTAASLLAQAPDTPRRATFSTTTNVVVVDVHVSDASGKPITSLTKDDFLLFEDGKPQTLLTCDLQHLESKVLPSPERQLIERNKTPAPPKPAAEATPPDKQTKFQDRRLMIMFFDFSSMQPPEQIRAVNAAIKFLGTQMTASDMVSIMVFGSTLKTVQEFTDDRDLLISTHCCPANEDFADHKYFSR